MNRVLATIGVCALAAAAVVAQQARPTTQTPAKPGTSVSMSAAGPITTSIRATFDEVKDYILRSAQMVDDKDFGFKPAGVAAEVRSYGQILGHIANANYGFCGSILGAAGAGEHGPKGEDYEKIASHVEMEKALAAAFAYCDKAYTAVNDRNGGDSIKLFFGAESTKLGALAYNNAHNFEHYGNLVTYLRAMGKVPPSSQPKK
ncbi:MAG TPA: DinB family protein [Vicinamibacterales bacterium]|nr:DinB family protein [Vicinamibacterales bacterium]